MAFGYGRAGQRVWLWLGGAFGAAATNSPSSWVLASDGFYYWTSSVKPLDKTGVLIKSVSEKKADGKNLVVDISTQAIQSTPDDAVTEAWNCTVKDGVLVPPHGGA